MKYTAKYFKDVMPEAHRKKGSFFVRYFFRPLSYPCASLSAKLKLSANTVSYMSALIALAACFMFIMNSHIAHIIGGILANVWLLMDCIDGNLARGVRKQPFGEFADSMSSYILVGLICTVMGYATYIEGGIIVPRGTPWIIIMGALASSSDSLMRLIYQKYKNVERKMADQGIVEPIQEVWSDDNLGQNWKVRVEFELGICGILPPAILVAAIFKALDLVVIYCFFYYGASFISSVSMYVIRAIRADRSK